MSSVKAKDLYRGFHINEETQYAVLKGKEVKLHGSTVKVILDNGIVVPRGLDRPKRCRCGGLIIAEPCLFCQLNERKE